MQTNNAVPNSIYIYNLSHLGLIQASGIDAEKFLQGQLTCDVREVTPQQNRLGAHCDPKGRIQATFRLFKQQENYYFLLPRNMIQHLLTCLQKYAVFSKVKLEDVSEQQTDLQIRFMEMTYPKIQMLLWPQLEIESGIANIYPETIGEFTPHQINYHLVNGVSFNKGCYTGQEIIARMHYRGKAKQQMQRVSFSSKHTPVPGTPIYNTNAENVGTIISAVLLTEDHHEALAVLQNTAIHDPIYLMKPNGSILTILDLPYTV